MSTSEPRRPHPAAIPFDELEPTEHSHEFVGAEHVKSGTAELRLTAIHGAGRFDTEWLAGPDEAWTSRPKP